MFIDSSAIVEILIDGDEAQLLLSKMAEAPLVCTGPTVIYEAAVVLTTRLGREPEEMRLLIQKFFSRFGINVLPASEDIAFAAVDAFSRYGKGRHPARLNFGDCFSYAGAKGAQTPLLYVGQDFAQTDLA